MLSQNITKQQFILQVLERDIRNIYKAQLAIAQHNIYVGGKNLKATKKRGPRIGVRSGALLRSLQNPDYLIQAQGEKFTVSASIVKHIRFLDMKKLGNRRIYNRQLYGILQKNTRKDIRFHYGTAIRDAVGDAIREALATKK